MSSKISIALFAAVGLISASPALAGGKSKEQGAMFAKEQSEPNAKTRYCAKAEMVTGSIRQGRICKTADEWRAEGVDVSKLQTRN